MSDFEKKKAKVKKRNEQQQLAQESFSQRKAPQSIKQQRKETVAEAIGSNYKENLKSLFQMQSLINKIFIEHPVYQEYHKRAQVAKLYKELHDKHMDALKNVNELYRLADKQYGRWLQVSSLLEKKNLTLIDKVRLWILLKLN